MIMKDNNKSQDKTITPFHVKDLIRQVIANGKVDRGLLGDNQQPILTKNKDNPYYQAIKQHPETMVEIIASLERIEDKRKREYYLDFFLKDPSIGRNNCLTALLNSKTASTTLLQHLNNRPRLYGYLNQKRILAKLRSQQYRQPEGEALPLDSAITIRWAMGIDQSPSQYSSDQIFRTIKRLVNCSQEALDANAQSNFLHYLDKLIAKRRWSLFAKNKPVAKLWKDNQANFVLDSIKQLRPVELAQKYIGLIVGDKNWYDRPFSNVPKRPKSKIAESRRYELVTSINKQYQRQRSNVTPTMSVGSVAHIKRASAQDKPKHIAQAIQNSIRSGDTKTLDKMITKKRYWLFGKNQYVKQLWQDKDQALQVLRSLTQLRPPQLAQRYIKALLSDKHRMMAVRQTLLNEKVSSHDKAPLVEALGLHSNHPVSVFRDNTSDFREWFQPIDTTQFNNLILPNSDDKFSSNFDKAYKQYVEAGYINEVKKDLQSTVSQFSSSPEQLQAIFYYIKNFILLIKSNHEPEVKQQAFDNNLQNIKTRISPDLANSLGNYKIAVVKHQLDDNLNMSQVVEPLQQVINQADVETQLVIYGELFREAYSDKPNNVSYQQDIQSSLQSLFDTSQAGQEATNQLAFYETLLNKNSDLSMAGFYKLLDHLKSSSLNAQDKVSAFGYFAEFLHNKSSQIEGVFEGLAELTNYMVAEQASDNSQSLNLLKRLDSVLPRVEAYLANINQDQRQNLSHEQECYMNHCLTNFETLIEHDDSASLQSVADHDSSETSLSSQLVRYDKLTQQLSSSMSPVVQNKLDEAATKDNATDLIPPTGLRHHREAMLKDYDRKLPESPDDSYGQGPVNH